jgi:hypothetical protein
MMPAQCRQHGQQHNAGNDASGMRAKRKHNSGKRQRGTGRTFEGQLGNNAGATLATRKVLMLAMMPAQCERGHQCNTKKNAIAAFARLPKAKIAVGRRWVQQRDHGQ